MISFHRQCVGIDIDQFSDRRDPVNGCGSLSQLEIRLELDGLLITQSKLLITIVFK
jgi:hypothetical protein